jgi:UDP-galactose transporter B1
MYSRRALFLACIALALTNVESAKVPSSPTAVLKKRAFTTSTTATARMEGSQSFSSSILDTTNDATVSADSISNIHRGGKAATTTTMSSTKTGLPDAVKLVIGAGGIYAAFLYYGSLQEDVFRYTAADGGTFQQAWFLQVLEALANVVIGFLGMQLMGPTKNIPLTMFGISGAAQVTAKACTSLALANGLSFPVATLAKSGKMAPVMAGSLLLGGAKYSLREYLQVAAIIGGTAIVSMGKKKGGSSNSMLGVFYIVMSLVFDGVTAGFQKKLKVETAKAGVKPKPYDFMYWTNLFMALTAAVVAIGLGEFTSGLAFCTANPDIMSKIIKFSLCSAVGQSFIFYTISNFDPLVLSTVTTTRKIFSVILSIVLKGHSLSLTGWSGIALSCGGILSEMQSKSRGKNKSQ